MIQTVSLSHRNLKTRILPLAPRELFGNRLDPYTELKNTYWGVRHLKALLPASNFVSTCWFNGQEIGLDKNSFSNLRISEALDDESESREILVVSSGMKRADRTAKPITSKLGCHFFYTATELRERELPRYEGCCLDPMKALLIERAIAQRDLTHPQRSYNGIESIASVCDRATGLIEHFEETFSGAQIILVAHNYLLATLQACFTKCVHHDLWTRFKLQNGEITKFNLNPDV